MQRKRYIHEAVTTGRLTLPVAIVIVSLFWLIGGISSVRDTGNGPFWDKVSPLLQGSFLQGITAYLLLGAATMQLWVLHNRFALIRTHTNFHLTLFVLFAGLLLPQTLQVANVLIPCVLFATYFLFKTYQIQQPVGYVFQSFFFIGLGSLFFPPLLYYLPFMYAALGAFQALTRRTFFAGVVAVCLPYWVLFAHAFCTGQMELFTRPFTQLVPEWPPHYDTWTTTGILALAYIVFLSVAGSLHCLIHNYEDKIRTRAYLTYIVMFQLWTLLLLTGQPQHFRQLFPLLVTGSCTLAGHLFVLGRGKAFNLFFLFCALLFAALILFNVWTHWQKLS